MKRLIFALGMVVAGLCNPASAHTAECFASPAAVFAAHPNASHASYKWRAQRPERCWYADAFKTQAEDKAKAKPAPRRAATIAQTSEPGLIAAPTPQPRITAVAFTSQPRIAAVAPASPPVIARFPRGITAATQIAASVQADDSPADFESRFSASGYKAP